MGKYLKKFNTHAEYEKFTQKSDFIKPNVSHCIQENEVHYNPYVDPYNGHQYVDLGLPSGTKWATMNVGATKPEEYGLYFAWGETQGYTASQVGTDKQFSWSDYALTKDSGSTMSKYNSTDGKTVLDLGDDAAHVNWGGDWHMPTKAQMEELTANTTYQWVTNYKGSGINGGTFTATNGAVLFFPAAGYCGDGKVDNVGSRGYVWASALSSEFVEDAWGFFFNSSRAGVNYGYRRFSGRSVRPVVG